MTRRPHEEPSSLPTASDNRSMPLTDAISRIIGNLTKNFDAPWLIPDITNDKQPQSEWNCDRDPLYEATHEPHSHQFLEICFCLEGQSVIRYNNDILQLRAGDVCVIMPDVIHVELPEKHGQYKALWLATDFHRVVAHTVFRDYSRNVMLLEGDQCSMTSDFHYIVQNLLKERTNEGKYAAELVKSYILQVLYYTLRNLERPAEQPGSGNWRDSVVDKVRQYVELHYTRLIRLSEISQELCVSINHLNHIFKTETGRTIIQYIEDFKMAKAKQMLSETDESIGSIASRLGYYDQYHFSKIFKKETSSTPTQHRNRKSE